VGRKARNQKRLSGIAVRRRFILAMFSQKKLSAEFGSVADFKKKFAESAINNFGSGWTWLCQNSDGKLEIVSRALLCRYISHKGIF
jgi:hypothetical protein